MADTTDADKRELRRRMRDLRRGLPDLRTRSDRLWAHVCALPEVVDAEVVMVFDSIRGEPVTAPFVRWCRERGKRVVLPEGDPSPDPAVVDVVIVPGLAFTRDGDRLGQGGGWYDRFLTGIRPDCLSIGVGWSEQVLDELPVESHDVRLDRVATETGLVIGYPTPRNQTQPR